MNTTELLARIRQLAKLPDSANSEDWTDSELLVEATNALYTRFSQPIQNLGESWWAQRWQWQSESGVSEYRVPARCLAGSFIRFEVSRDEGRHWRLMKVLTPGKSGMYESPASGSDPSFFSYEGGFLKVYPVPMNSTVQFRLVANLRPSKLIPVVTPGTVTAVNVTSQQVDIQGDPSAFLALTGGKLDVVNTDGSCEVVMNDVTYTAISFISGSTYRIQFPAAADVSKCRPGQVVRAPDTSDHIPLPVELHHALACYTAGVVLTANGDSEKAGSLVGKCDKDLQRFVDAVTPRGKAHPYRFSARNTWMRRNVPRRF